MKQSITTALCLGLFSCVYAQETLYSQDFEGNNDDIFANGWNVINLYENSNYEFFNNELVEIKNKKIIRKKNMIYNRY